MRFRSLIDLVPFLPLILAQTTLGSNCRCSYGDECWPSEKAFASLASMLSQPLVHPVPGASPCYPVNNPSGNCSEVQQNWGDGNWRADHPGTYENINFEAYTYKNGSISACYLNTTLGFPCEQGNVPPIGVDARTIEDIQAAVKFASRHNLRLVVKNTGHDYLGRSAGRGAFMIWTHHLKNITYDVNFVPEGGSNNDVVPAFTLGAGVQWVEAYTAAAQQKRFLLGGISAGMSVGAAGGWIQGGGHSAFSATYGLGVDNAIQFTIVTPSGDHITTNAYEHSDLFWALRGGGAGSWGVITSVTYKSHDLFPLVMSGVNITIPTPSAAQSIATEFIKLHPKLSDAGWGGYSSLSNTSLMALFVVPNVSWADANNTIQPFFDFCKNVTGNPNIATFSYPFEDFHAWLNSTFGMGVEAGSQVGGNVELASRLLSRDAAENRPEETARLLLSFDFAAFNFVAGGAVSRVDPDSVGLNPGWRKAVALVYTAEGWNEGASSGEIQQARQRVAAAVPRLDPISPDSATYQNEASLYEPDFKKSFFGSHYERLEDIKKKYDPESLFIVAEGVGSEHWNGDLMCKY
ncbi:6-hydroxy-D-nicotine oxidase [Leucoagaricus sp. SymC.cos]|nr:6-hydroxy-D-nicotine oxidase [Leucoagaricus sp. SymC.cos]